MHILGMKSHLGKHEREMVDRALRNMPLSLLRKVADQEIRSRVENLEQRVKDLEFQADNP